MIFAINALTNIFFRFFFLIYLFSKKNFSLFFRILFLSRVRFEFNEKTNDDDSHLVAVQYLYKSS